MSQSQLGNGPFQYTIEIDGTEVHSVQNNQPQKFENLKVYKSDPWYASGLAKVANIKVETEPGDFVVTKNILDRKIPVLRQEWELSVEIKAHV